MKTKFKLFLFTDQYEIQTLISDWLDHNDVLILNIDTITLESRVFHFVYYIENLPVDNDSPYDRDLIM